MENIYIAALEIGKSQIEDGITYLELKQALTDRGFKIGGQLENNFQFWFYSNFYCGHIFFIIQKDSIHKEKNLESEYQRAKNQKAYLTGDAHSKYIEYLELKEAREASAASMAKADESIVLATKSTTQAKNALMVSIIALSITFLVSVVTFVADRISASNNTSRQNLQKPPMGTRKRTI